MEDDTYLNISISVAALVKIAHVRTSAIGVDLVDSHSDLATGLDLSHLASRKGILSVLANVDVARQLSATTLVDDVGSDLCITNDGGILLARVDGHTVASNLGINCRSC